MAPNTRNHAATIQWPESKNLIAIMAHLSETNSDLHNILGSATVAKKQYTTRQTLDNIYATIEWWVTKRVYCDKEKYRGKYTWLLEQWTILKHQIETIIANMNTLSKKPKNLWSVINYYNGLSRLLEIRDKKIHEINTYPEEKIWFDTEDRNTEVNSLLDKKMAMLNVSDYTKDILYMNKIKVI